MKFEEKLIKLRKQKVLSQEELAEKLNVTRQTISKWELGQSKPDMDKLIEMSKLFEVSLENLANDELGVEGKEPVVEKTETKKQERKPRKFLLYIIIIIFIAAIITLAARITLEREKNKEEGNGIINGFFNVFNDISGQMKENYEQNVEEMNKDFEEQVNQMNQQYEEQVNQMNQQHEENVNKQKDETNKNMFNSPFTFSAGTQPTVHVKMILDNVIKSNKTNADHKIIFVYKGTETMDEQQIKNVKHSLKQFGEYEVSVDYDENGYVNKITLEDIK